MKLNTKDVLQDKPELVKNESMAIMIETEYFLNN